MEETLTPHQKALRINLDPLRYGTFAEIGAGQEVVRWFFRVGGAAGTISKSMSAYDMKVSDAIYGECDRYVSKQRLQSMLDYEHDLNISRLREIRGNNTAFFAFADTVSARSFKGGNECHGWMGIKFQSHPRDEDSQIIIHVRMLDNDNALQQEAIGIVGVNLIYGAFSLHHRPNELLASLLDNLTPDRIEIDMIEFSGIEFRYIDNRAMALKLVEKKMSKAAMFAADGSVLQPAEVLYKRPVLVERGSFRPVTNVNIDMLRCAQEQFSNRDDVDHERIVPLMEITMSNLMGHGSIDLQDFLARADMMAASGTIVLISDFSQYHRLTTYLDYFARSPIGITMGAKSLLDLFDERYYSDLQGGVLEGIGRLFKDNLTLYIYPYLEGGELLTVDNLKVPEQCQLLYQHLVQNKRILPIKDYNADFLHIFSRDILTKIERQDPTWEEGVPESVADIIKERCFFGYNRTSS